MELMNHGDFEKSGRSNMILYIGLGMVCVGLVVTFVGLGDKGFQTLELQLVGPSLIGCGVLFTILQILYCTFPSFRRSCWDEDEDSDKLLREEEMFQGSQNKRSFQRNKSRIDLREKSSNIFMIRQNRSAPSPQIPVSTLKPILKTGRQTSMSSVTGLSLAQHRRENVSFDCKFSPNLSQLRSLEDDSLVLNSAGLFINSDPTDNIS